MNSQAGFPESIPPARLWEGRMGAGASDIFSAYVDSIGFDIILAPYDVQVSRAHAKMLRHVGIIEKEVCQSILDGFDVIEHEISTGEFRASLVETDEDVHTAIERRLTELTGDAGRALHTGRSRNDLTQMSARLFTRDALIRIQSSVIHTINTLCDLAEKNIHIVMPGKTHMQHAQPILVSHWLLSHASRLANDLERIDNAMDRVNVCVLGSGALAGSTLDLDIEFVCKELGCNTISQNSIAAVSTRDYVAETLFILTQIMVNLSCLGEDVVWMTSTECGYAILDDQFASGSSMMPQKKNPDIAELVRGKAGLSIGSLTAILSATKSQIFGYNHDLQVDKEALFSAVKDCELSLVAMDAMMATTKFNEDACEKSLREHPLLLSTDIAEVMVSSGIPFRIAYKAVAVCIRRALDENLNVEDLCEYLRDDDLIGAAAKTVLGDPGTDLVESMRSSVERRNTVGGTATSAVQNNLKVLRKIAVERNEA